MRDGSVHKVTLFFRFFLSHYGSCVPVKVKKKKKNVVSHNYCIVGHNYEILFGFFSHNYDLSHPYYDILPPDYDLPWDFAYQA